MFDTLSSDQLRKAQQAYFVGIGGAGMSALARLLHAAGIQVSGSDLKDSRSTRQLQEDGIPVFIGQKQSFLDPSADFLVYSSAIAESHVEFQAAKRMGIRTLHRAAVLSSLFNDAKTSIGVAGTHGKTTTSSMVSFVLRDLGMDPTCMVGGEVVDFGTNARVGKSGIYVSELDESDRSHELFTPHYAILTNLEEEHVDQYACADELYQSFQRFIDHLHDPGLIVYSHEDTALRELVMNSHRPKVSFGFMPEADFSARNVVLRPNETRFDLFECGIFDCPVSLNLIGLHNVSNALACIAMITQLGRDPLDIAASLSRFHGARRRLEVKLMQENMTIINDYAHNPTKVRASVKALRVYDKPVTVVFQPHRYTRTTRFIKQFAEALLDCDHLIITDIYSAGEVNTSGITSVDLFNEMRQLGHPHVRFLRRQDIIPAIMDENPAGVIAFLGAGDIGETANEFTDRVKSLASA